MRCEGKKRRERVCYAVRAGVGGKVRDMATVHMYRKVGIGMGRYVLLFYGAQAWTGRGHEEVSGSE